MITAAQAKENAEKASETKANEALEEASLNIEEAAKRGIFEVRLYGHLWSEEGYYHTAAYEKALKGLNDLGFKAFFVPHTPQNYTLVKWS